MKLGIFSTHPIQYQVPLWRNLHASDDWDTQVFYFSDQGVGNSVDPGFGHAVTWDLPLLDGYESTFLSKRPIEEDKQFEIPSVRSFLHQQKLDVVLLHGYMNRFARQIVRHKNQFGYKVILRGEFSEMKRRSFDWKKHVRRVYLKWFYSYVDHFCPIGVDAVEHLGAYGIADEKVTLAPYSVDDQLFESRAAALDKQKCREELGISGSSKVFLFSGKMIPRKQPLLYAEAILEVVDRFQDIAVVFVGSGPQLDELKQKLLPKLQQRLIAPGFVNQSELGTYFKASDVFVLPSRFDTWGLVVNEAMHFGLPCIVSDMVGSRRDLIKDGETGFVFKHQESEDLAAQMRRFLVDEKAAGRMGKNAHQLIQNYSIASTVSGIETAVSKVMHSERNHAK
jgi:glycosyltransferase involved in cell wall biosynthesis